MKRNIINNKKTSNQSGFTIIELLIATTIFAFILLIATAGIVRIGQLYYKGITESRTEENIRAVSDELARSVQFATGYKIPISSPANIEKFCLGDTRYTGYIDQEFKTGTNNTGLVAETLTPGSSCAGCTNSCVLETRQLLGSNTRLLKLNVEKIGASSDQDAWDVDVRIAYGDDDLLTHNDTNGNRIDVNDKLALEDASCRAGISGGTFCSVARLDTVVKKRLN